jgi:periplasmic protein TonB
MILAALLLAAALFQDPQPLPASGQLDLDHLAPRAANPRPQTSGPDITAIFRQAYTHWTPTCDAAGIAGHRIAFDLTLDAEGRIIEGPTLVRPQQDANWRAAAETARLALLGSAPFDVPPDFTGGTYRPVFVTARACARAAEADED